MNDEIEQAFQQGYEQGKKDALKKANEKLADTTYRICHHCFEPVYFGLVMLGAECPNCKKKLD